ncbi:MAG: carboxymuconolactone decarboxylase family protein [Acidimicrobiales bacterium]|jgi:AhpD family alkylhydroperoxidase
MQTTRTIPVRLDLEKYAPSFTGAMSQLDKASVKQLDLVELDARLRELVRIRASQLNGCAYCVDTHTKDARSIGESEQRIYALPVWREAPFFTERERAALGFTETVTLVANNHVPAEAYHEVAAQLSPAEIAALLGLIVTINAWNMLAVASRAWEPAADRQGELS